MKKFRLFTLIALFNLAANYAHPITPTYFKMLHLNNSVFGTAFAFMSLGIFLASPFWSKVTSMTNSKYIIAIGCIGYAIAQFLFAIGHVVWIILAGRLLAGLACGAFFVGVLTYIINLSDKQERGTNLTMNATIQTVASALGYFIGGVLGSYNIYIAFAIQIIQLSLVGILFYLLLANDYTENSKLKLSSLLRESNPLKRIEDGKLFMNRYFVILFIISTTLCLSYTAFDQSFNYYLKDVFNLSSSFNGSFKGIIGIISLIVNMSIGLKIMKSKNINRWLLFILIGCLFAITGFITNQHLHNYIFFSCIFYGFYALSVPALQDIITRQSQINSRNLVLGFYQSTQSLGQIMGAYLAGIIYNFSSIFPFYLAIISLSISVFFSWYYLKLKK